MAFSEGFLVHLGRDRSDATTIVTGTHVRVIGKEFWSDGHPFKSDRIFDEWQSIQILDTWKSDRVVVLNFYKKIYRGL